MPSVAIVITAAVIMAAIVAAVLAVLLRWWDEPVNAWDKKFLLTVVKFYIGAQIAVGYQIWVMLSNGVDILDPYVFAGIVLIGVGGMGSARAILTGGKKILAEKPAS
jgi:hypothetical protein